MKWNLRRAGALFVLWFAMGWASSIATAPSCEWESAARWGKYCTWGQPVRWLADQNVVNQDLAHPEDYARPRGDWIGRVWPSLLISLNPLYLPEGRAIDPPYAYARAHPTLWPYLVRVHYIGFGGGQCGQAGVEWYVTAFGASWRILEVPRILW